MVGGDLLEGGFIMETETEQALSLDWIFFTGSMVMGMETSLVFFTCVCGTFIFVPVSLLLAATTLVRSLEISPCVAC